MSITCVNPTQSTDSVSTASQQRADSNQSQEYERYVFVLQQHNGTYVIGVSTNPSKRLAAINSGMNPHIKQSLTIKTVVGIKPVTADRNLITVVKAFADKYGEDKLIVV